MTLYAGTLPELVARVSDRLRLEVGGVVGMPVFDGEPIVTDWPTYLARFKQADDGRLEGWVTDVGYQEEAFTLGPVSEITLACRVRGFRSVALQSGSREAFRHTIAGLFDHFRRGNLGGLVDILDPPTTQLETGVVIEDVLLSDVLVHRCHLLLSGRTEIG